MIDGRSRTVLGAVLCGGASRRMGTDKAVVTVDGLPMVQRVVDALRGGGVDNVVCIGGDTGALTALGYEVVPDTHPGDGPLGGLLTSFAAARHRGATHVLVAACDMPSLDTFAVAAVLAAPPAAVVAAAASRVEPLLSLWDVDDAGPVLASAFAAGERAVHRAWVDLDVQAVEVRPGALRNVNTPEDVPVNGNEGL